MKAKDTTINLELKTSSSGEYEATVMQVDEYDSNGNPSKYHPVKTYLPQKNLILPAGRSPNGYNLVAQMKFFSTYAQVGTGTTPNKVILDGTFSQTAFTVTRASGTGVFASGNVNDFIKFASGETARITAFTNTLTVTVDRSQTVAAAALTVYDTSRVTLDTFVAATNNRETGATGFTEAFDTGVSTWWDTWNFAVESVARTYTEFGIGGSSGGAQLISRVLFDTPVNVDIGQFLQVKFTLKETLMNYRTSSPYNVAITGWPYSYAIQSIVSNGTYWDVVLDKAHHYAVGRPITIAGATPPQTAISSISSTGSDFTITAAAHGKIAGDSIVVAGATPAGYNGTWTVASVTTNTITVTSGINPGSGSGGTVRLATPGTWYNGTYTIASIPNSTTLRITNATSIIAAGIAGTVKNNLNASAIITGRAFNMSQFPGSSEYGRRGAADCSYNTNGNPVIKVKEEANLGTGMQFGVDKTEGTILAAQPTAVPSYDPTTRTLTWTATFASGQIVSTTIRQILYVWHYGMLWITFEERQRKDDGYQLVIVFTESWEPDLN